MRTNPSASSFGELLKRFRLAAGLSQEDLAERAGLSPRGVSDLERGARTNPRPGTVRLLADALALADTDRAVFLAAAQGSARLAPVPSADPATSPSRAAPSRPAPSPPSPPTGTVTFLFTDIEGSTRLLQQLGGPRYADVLTEHQRLLRAAFTAHDGYEVDTQGDSFFVAFPTAPDALAAAVEATQVLAAHTWLEGVAVRVRMGLHTGAPHLVGDRYVGLDVHRAARIAAAGHGGQILLSEATFGLVRTALPDGTTLRDLGAHRLKDLQQAERVYQAVLPSLPGDFPPLKALDARPHNLLVQPSPILGREHEVAAICTLLRRDDVRLVTLTGPGGIGKTRLSLEVAAEVLDAFSDGVWNVRLARLSDPEFVLPTIATTLNLKESGAAPLADVLRSYLQDKHLLLVLDNFEQVVPAASQVSELLAACSGVTVLATSRVPLRLQGEHEYAVRPLALPDPARLPPPEQLSQYAAVALFIERAQAAQADFRVTNATAPAVAEICARLDGLPLAIELAAARVKLLPPPALLKRLERLLSVLVGGARDLEERQQTMLATLAWSYDLLAPDEQRLFRRLAVFVGGCTLEAAEAVCAAPEGAEPLELDVLEGLSRLVDQSLIQQRAESEEDGEPRFGMLHVIREFALELLGASNRNGECEALRQAHAGFYVALGEQAETGLAGPEAAAWLTRLERDHDNLRAVLSWARERGQVETGLRLAAAIWRFWWQRGNLREGRAWVEGLLGLASESRSRVARGAGASGVLGSGAVGKAAGKPSTADTVPDAVRARAVFASGTLALWQGDDAAAATRLEQALELGRAVGDLRTAAYALTDLGDLAGAQGDWERAAARLEESLALWREVGSLRGMAVALLDRGEIAYFQGDLERAAASAAEAQTLFRQLGDPDGIAVSLSNLGRLMRRQGELAHAEALLREALALHWKQGYVRRCAEDLEFVAATAGAAMQGKRAARLLGAAAMQRERLGAPQPRQERADVQQAVAAVCARLGEQEWQAAYTAGQALSLEEAIAEALGDEAPTGHEGDD